ncbi:MAG: alkaline phosphatase D family protein [Bacteroidota bacterium]
MRPASFLLFFLSYFSLFAQSAVLQSGPMVGYSEMTEVQLWVQTKEVAKIHFNFWEKGSNPSDMRTSASIRTEADQAFTAKVTLSDLMPGKTYEYRLFINDQELKFPYPTEFQTQVLWQWRTDPPNFKIAVGSCSYINEPKFDRPGKGYGGEYEIFESIHEQAPDAMVWLGDNTYLREVDWYTQSGIFHRYTHTRSTKEIQPLLASTHHYAIWDDHDFGPNDSDRSFIHKDKTLDAFERFWANPTTGIPQMEGGITTQFKWGDIDFFLLDDRYFRSPNNCKTCEPTIMGEAQFNWLIEALTTSRAPFKIVAIGGQVLSTAEVYENYAHHHKRERALLLKRIEKEGIKNVVFLTGDRHHTELSKLVNDAGNTLYDITVSPLTSGVARSKNEVNDNRVPNTLVHQHNYGILEFSGPRLERQLKISIYSTQSELLWTQTIVSEAK